MDKILNSITQFFSKTQTTIMDKKFEGITDQNELSELYEMQLNQGSKTGNRVAVFATIIAILLIAGYVLIQSKSKPVSDITQTVDQSPTAITNQAEDGTSETNTSLESNPVISY